MMNRSVRTRVICVLPAIVFAGTACSEANQSGVLENPTPQVEAVLTVSEADPAPGAVVTVWVDAVSKQGIVGSYTARIAYDTTALRFDSEVPLSDRAARAYNPTAGALRIAGAAATGFPDGRLASYNFVVLRSNAMRTISLAVDEMHMISRFDAKPSLTVLPVRGASR